MKHFALPLALIAGTCPAMAQQGTVEIDPGLWAYTTTVSVVGRGVVDENSYTTCIPPEKSTVNVAEFVADLMEGDCQQNSFSQTVGSAELNMTCTNAEDQTVATGVIQVDYTSSGFTGTARATITGPGGSVEAQTLTKARRTGDC